MAESSITGDSKVILHYKFKPDGLWSSSKENNSDNSISQFTFIERLGNTLWCSCTNCVIMLLAIECTCCQEFPGVEECLEGVWFVLQA